MIKKNLILSHLDKSSSTRFQETGNFLLVYFQVRMRQLQVDFSCYFFSGGRLPGENVTAANSILLTFLRWQAPR